MYVSFIFVSSVSLGMGESGDQLVGTLLVLGVRLVGGLSESGLGIVCVRDIDDGVRVMGGAGSAHRSRETGVVVGVRVSLVLEGLGVGVGAGSAQSSLDVVGLVVVVGALLLEGLGVGVGAGSAQSSIGGEKLNAGALGDSIGGVGGVEVLVAVVVVGVIVGGVRRCFALRSRSFACRISCRRRIIFWRRVVVLFMLLLL